MEQREKMFSAIRGELAGFDRGCEKNRNRMVPTPVVTCSPCQNIHFINSHTSHTQVVERTF